MSDSVLARSPKVKQPNEVLGMAVSFAELLQDGETIEDVERIVVASTGDFRGTVNGTVDVVSSAAGDTTQTLTVFGVTPHGALVSEELELTGTTAVEGETEFETVYQVTLDVACVGTVSVRKGGTLTVLEDVEAGTLTVPRLPVTEAEVNAVTMFDDDGGEIAVGEGVSFTVAGGKDGVDYRIIVDVSTSADNVRTGVCPLEVRDGVL